MITVDLAHSIGKERIMKSGALQRLSELVGNFIEVIKKLMQK